MMTEDFTDLERSVMEMLLSGEQPTLRVLRQQFAASRPSKREHTGVGFFTYFDVPASTPRPSIDARVRIDDVQATLSGLQYGAGFVLFVSNGVIEMLEGYTYDEPWPRDAQLVNLRYSKLPRDLAMLESDRT